MSKTYTAAVIGILALVLPFLGLEVTDDATLNASIEGVITTLSLVFIAIDRFLKGDISFLGIKKN